MQESERVYSKPDRKRYAQHLSYLLKEYQTCKHKTGMVLFTLVHASNMHEEYYLSLRDRGLYV